MSDFRTKIESMFSDMIACDGIDTGMVFVTSMSDYEKMIKELQPLYVFYTFRNYCDNDVLENVDYIEWFNENNIDPFQEVDVLLSFEYNTVFYCHVMRNEYWNNKPSWEDINNMLREKERSQYSIERDRLRQEEEKQKEEIRHVIKKYCFGNPEFTCCKDTKTRKWFSHELYVSNPMNIDLSTITEKELYTIIDEYYLYLKYRGQLQ